VTRKTLLATGGALAILLVAAAGLALAFLKDARSFDPGKLEEYYTALRVKTAQPVPAELVREGIASAARYIRSHTGPSGRFVYLVNMDPDVPVPQEYNILRHAGTIYSLGLANTMLPDAETTAVMGRAVDYMRECCLKDLEGGKIAAVAEPDAIASGKRALGYKLGGAGLALVALATYAEIEPGSVPLQDMQKLAGFGQFMQSRRGEFYAKYVPAKGGRQFLGASLYYPGEMALGWLKLYEQQPDAALIESTVKALTFLARERAGDGSAPADHWALLATAKLFELAERERLDIPRDVLFNHALQVCHAMLEEGYAPQPMPVMEGALVPNGVVTPTATRLEGLLAALAFLPEVHPMRKHVEAAVHRGVDFLLRAQVRGGPYDGALPFAITRVPLDSGTGAAEFNAQAGEIRIDYVQHSMSAMVQYLDWIE
jgi:hypothetical protein